jgi:hypothetical protein
MELPMLDEEEYKVIAELYSQGIRATKEFRQKYNLPLDKCSMEERFRPLLQKYQEITGFEETVANAVMHHRISLYGPPCQHCGKPLRSPKAALCVACGQPSV